MAQTQRPQQLEGLQPDTNPALIRFQTEFTLTIRPGQDGVRPLTLLTQDIQRLQIVLAKCKRLKEMADVDVPKSYAWLAPYTSKHTPISLLSSSPPDLRIITRPLHTRLSLSSAGMPVDDLTNIEVIRNDWVQNKARQDVQVGENVTIRIRVGTFNVNGKMPSQDLASWVAGRSEKSHENRELQDDGKSIPALKRLSHLPLGEISPDSASASRGSLKSETQSINTQATTLSSSSTLVADDDPDVLVLGFQELDLSTEALLYSTGTTREDAWCMAVFAGLGEKGVWYEKLVSKQLVGMLLLVIVKKSITACFRDIKMTAAGAGIMGLMGNKGGTAIRLTLTPPGTPNSPNPSPTVLTFVNTHLAAFDEMADKRNADFHDLGTKLKFNTGSTYDVDGNGNFPSPLSIYESDVLIWMVHLNYRVDLQDADVRGLLVSDIGDNVQTLLKYDQLKNAQRDHRAFDNFVEHPISHIPTYRFSAGVLTDDMGFDRKRKPAWTDRILHLSAPSIGIQQLSYTSHPEITMSDHRPVSAEFSLQLGIIDAPNYYSVVHKLYHGVSDFEESAEPPKVKLDNDTVIFGKISYRQRVSQSLGIQNQGNVPCAFHFIPQDSEMSIHPEWMCITPMTVCFTFHLSCYYVAELGQGLLLPKEKTVINFTAHVDNNSAAKLNLVSRHIQYTLILHTALGQDYFITVTGEYQHTCFANSLSLLTRLPGPIRDLENLEALLPERLAINAPREIMRLVNWMMANAINVDGLFVSSAEEQLISIVRECLDTGADFPKVMKDDPRLALAVAQTLLQLLDSLPEPVIPVSLYARCAQVTSRDEAFEFLDELPSEAVNVWISITAFVHFIGQQASVGDSEASQGKAERLAAIFAPVFLRDDTSSYPPISPIGKRNFLLHFIS
ncbi:hypothetical protein PILCRDRAFT_457561 [Piloderma croceum F 1598]|uniref:Rho-GAP domain-containing protein n=1 Tax=Piloderma croceum (strain F 1598) TaxID=765440 RepID=A0A0C3FEH1_PILCF|nr:hypothetical protein PILCRDRAFT_457561 [Piloderma croceum F 1598]